MAHVAPYVCITIYIYIFYKYVTDNPETCCIAKRTAKACSRQGHKSAGKERVDNNDSLTITKHMKLWDLPCTIFWHPCLRKGAAESWANSAFWRQQATVRSHNSQNALRIS